MKNQAKFVATILLTEFLVSLTAVGQQATGLIFDPGEFAKIPSVPMYTGSKDLTTKPYDKDLSPYCPLPLHQGNSKLCAAISTAYTAYGIQMAMVQKQVSSPEAIAQAYSLAPILPYRQLRQGCDEGLKLEEVAEYLKRNGDVFFRDLPALRCDDPSLLQYKSKEVAHITDYIRVFNEHDPADNKIENVSLRIHQNSPVIVGLKLRSNFKSLSTSDDYYYPSNGEPIQERHAMVVVGYDDTRAAFKLVNSWGTSWGQRGFFWMKYRDFATEALGGMVLVLPETVFAGRTNGRKLGGQFGFKAIYRTDDGLRSEMIRPQHSGNGRYELSRQDWKRGQRFQLLTQNTRPAEYMCVFSVSPKNEIKVHWPRNEMLAPYNENLYGTTESDITPTNNFDLIIPSAKSALTIEETGTDYLCVLYSSKPLLADIPALLERIRTLPGEVSTRIRTALGARLVPASAINYQADAMNFTAATGQGDTVPIILRVKSIEQ